MMDVTPDVLSNYRARERLRDGRHLLVRGIRPDDKAALQEGLQRLSAESAYYRFFRHKHDLSPEELVYFTEIDFDQHVALVAIDEQSGVVVGVGRYFLCQETPQRAAEITLAVDDAYHGRGVATVLLQHLVTVARAAGIAEFHAAVMGENHKMLDVLFNLGLPVQRTAEGAVVNVRLSLADASVG
ncbi:MAG: GNAT family N-acetyltransferase [Gammaproteobacteria bacterium]|nr:MAG: GNAT family N-acetyltransferase [Gammaproteobacteria bacterium]